MATAAKPVVVAKPQQGQGYRAFVSGAIAAMAGAGVSHPLGSSLRPRGLDLVVGERGGGD